MDFLFVRTIFLSQSLFAFLNSVKVFHYSNNTPWAGILLLVLISWFFWEKIYRKNFYFPGLIGGFLAFQLSADLLGNIFQFYKKFNWYDRLTHFTGGATLGLSIILILSYFYKKNNWNLRIRTLILFALSISLSLGVLYEFWEYFIYSVLNYTQVITGLTDTSRDLLIDFIGISFSVFIVAYFLEKKDYFSSLNPNLTDSKTK